MKHLFTTRLLACLAVLLLLGPGQVSAAPFTPGNLVVVRIGDGSAALTSAATATFLVEYTPAGMLVQTIALPVAAAGTNSILTNTGSSTSDAVLTRSANGAYLVLTGYDAAPGTAAVAGTTSATNNRIIGRVAADGTFDTSTRLSDGFSAGNIRSACTVDGTSFYAVGSNGGVRYLPFGNLGNATTTALNTAIPTNNRSVGTYGGNLYVSSATGTFFGLSQVGTGLPTAATQAITLLPGFATATGPSPYAFYFADLSTVVAGVDVAYTVDDRTTADGGIQKWSLVAGTWTLNGTIGSTATPAATLRGLNGQTTGTSVSLVASGGGGLYLLADNAGYNAAPSTTTLPTPVATAGTNTVFRGATFAPIGATTSNPLPTITSISPTTAPAGVATVGTITGTGFVAASVVNADGNPLPTTFISATQLSITVPAAAPAGPYSITVENPSPGGGISNAVVVTLTAAPVAPTITSLTPSSVVAGAGVFTVVVTGTGFVAGSVVSSTAPVSATTFISATQLSVALLTGAVVGSYPFTVTNPGGSASNIVNFVVTPAPLITGLAPAAAPAGGAAFTLTVTGTNFTASSVITFNGVSLTTTLVSATSLTATVPASAIATAGARPVTIATSTPGGTTSPAVNFAVTSVAPAIASFTPTTGGPGITVTLTGTNFTGATTVRIGSFNVPNFTVVSATSITLVVPGGTGSVNGLVTVITPAGTATSMGTFNLVSATLAGQALAGLTIAPNPATDQVTVTLPTAAAATVALRDLTGRLVLAPAPLAADQKLHLPASLAVGMYLLEVRQGAVTALRRIEKN